MSGPKINPGLINASAKEIRNHILSLQCEMRDLARDISGHPLDCKSSYKRPELSGLLPNIYEDQQAIAEELKVLQAQIHELRRFISGFPTPQNPAPRAELDKLSVDAIARQLSPRTA